VTAPALSTTSSGTAAGAPISEPAWVLAGGLGTRLRAAVADAPKVLAPIEGRPFLDILLSRLYARGFRQVLLLTGYLSEQVASFVADRASPADLTVTISREDSPLGTAGALGWARAHARGPFFLLNGDTFFDFDPRRLRAAHRAARADVTLAATRVPDGGRYGALELDDAGLVRAFREKDASAGPAAINAGVYLLEPSVLEMIPAGAKLSLETDVLPRLIAAGRPVAAAIEQGDFFDIGTPESYAAFAAYVRALLNRNETARKDAP